MIIKLKRINIKKRKNINITGTPNQYSNFESMAFEFLFCFISSCIEQKAGGNKPAFIITVCIY